MMAARLRRQPSMMLAWFSSSEITTSSFVRIADTVPAFAVTVTRSVTVAKPAGPIVPRLAVTNSPVPGGVGPLQDPMLETQERKVVPAGTVSLRVTAFAVAGPRFVTTIV